MALPSFFWAPSVDLEELDIKCQDVTYSKLWEMFTPCFNQKIVFHLYFYFLVRQPIEYTQQCFPHWPRPHALSLWWHQRLLNLCLSILSSEIHSFTFILLSLWFIRLLSRPVLSSPLFLLPLLIMSWHHIWFQSPWSQSVWPEPSVPALQICPGLFSQPNSHGETGEQSVR